MADSTTVSKGDDKLGMPELVNLEKSGLRRSIRIATQRSGIKRSVLTTLFCFGAILASPIASAEAGMKVALTTAQSAAYQFEQVNENFDGTYNGILYHVYTAAKEANESYTFKEMLKQDDRAKFVDAMEKEISDHTSQALGYSFAFDDAKGHENNYGHLVF